MTPLSTKHGPLADRQFELRACPQNVDRLSTISLFAGLSRLGRSAPRVAVSIYLTHAPVSEVRGFGSTFSSCGGFRRLTRSFVFPKKIFRSFATSPVFYTVCVGRAPFSSMSPSLSIGPHEGRRIHLPFCPFSRHAPKFAFLSSFIFDGGWDGCLLEAFLAVGLDDMVRRSRISR